MPFNGLVFRKNFLYPILRWFQANLKGLHMKNFTVNLIFLIFFLSFGALRIKKFIAVKNRSRSQ